MKILFVSCVSATIELDNNEAFYSVQKYDVYLNSELILKEQKENVFSLYNLKPDTTYVVKVEKEEITFKTEKVNRILECENLDNTGTRDVTVEIQETINSAGAGDLVVINKGTYLITSLKLKSNITLYLKEGCLLIGSINEDDYQEVDGEYEKDGKKYQVGTWEGLPYKLKLAAINVLGAQNVKIVGEGIIDQQAQKSTWWATFKSKNYARPHILFINQSKKIYVQGLSLQNSAQWCVHPYFCDEIGFYDLKITNPKISPNTDGINPQCCKGVEIIGIKFSVGDDCIAIKSGKKYIADYSYKPCENIEIRNCLMCFGHGAIVLGSEMSSGIKNVNVEKCYFNQTDRGLRIKTRRGRGNKAVVDNVTFKNIYMNNVLTPFTLNMFYFCDPDGKEEYVWSKEKLPVDERTPYLGDFEFNDIKAENCEVCAGYFYGLPEMHVNSVRINNCEISFKENATEGTPAMMTDAEVCLKRGFIFRNVDKVHLHNVKMSGQNGPKFETSGNDVIVDD